VTHCAGFHVSRQSRSAAFTGLFATSALIKNDITPGRNPFSAECDGE
jgi:hypothetical protein